jgi:hypothetical protein
MTLDYKNLRNNPFPVEVFDEDIIKKAEVHNTSNQEQWKLRK